MRYREQIDYLVSSLVYLGTHSYYWARSPSNLASELSLDAKRLQDVFESFPGLYRKSKSKTANGEHYYAVQARYAQRGGEDTSEPEKISYIEPLSTEQLRLIIDFVQQSAEAERAGRRAWITNTVSTLAAFVAAGAAIFAASVSN